MIRRIRKVAVLGSGVMGSGISCHLANAGFQVLLLDLPSVGHNDNLSKNGLGRSVIAEKALATAVKSKPAPLYHSSYASRIETGNFEDDLHRISECDWVIEVVIEQLDVKRVLFEKIEKYRKPGSLVTSNTSGIPIGLLAKGRSDDFRVHFCGTHFFNPARYMALFEVIPHEDTSQEVTDFWMKFGEVYLGKKAVLCKDTPAFIANRIGFYSGNKVSLLTEKYKLPIEVVDKLTSDPIGWPGTGSYRLLDLVGIDTSVKVTQGVVDNCPNDEFVQIIKDRPIPESTKFLLENRYLGDKSGQGYYKKTDIRDEKGSRIILALDLETLEYKPVQKPMIPALGISKKIEYMDRRLREIFSSDDPSCLFIKELLVGIMVYASNRIPEISEDIYSVDNAMKAGYAWTYGPFEYWDILGIKETALIAESLGQQVPGWIKELIQNGVDRFYISEEGNKKYYDLTSSKYRLIPGTEHIIHLDNFRKNTPVYKNSEAVLHDIGEGVLCLEFISKSNTIGEGIGQAAVEALSIAESGNWLGLVIGNNARNFSVGANLMAVGMYAMQKDYKKLEELVHGFQQINMALRYAPIPVVTATQGYVFGGGCEVLMHTDAAVCHAESYIGLVEVGVGLIPGGGGTKEFALRASDSFFEGDIQIPTLLDKLKVIAMATVSTSAVQAFDYGYLLHERDHVEMNISNVLASAKRKVIELSSHYTAPVKKDVMVLGRMGLATLYTAINEFYLGNYMSAYDQEIARKIAFVLCGGDLTAPQKVSEQYLLDLEKEAFLQLLGNQKTLDRIQYLLMNNKPLRN